MVEITKKVGHNSNWVLYYVFRNISDQFWFWFCCFRPIFTLLYINIRTILDPSKAGNYLSFFSFSVDFVQALTKVLSVVNSIFSRDCCKCKIDIWKATVSGEFFTTFTHEFRWQWSPALKKLVNFVWFLKKLVHFRVVLTNVDDGDPQHLRNWL